MRGDLCAAHFGFVFVFKESYELVYLGCYCGVYQNVTNLDFQNRDNEFPFIFQSSNLKFLHNRAALEQRLDIDTLLTIIEISRVPPGQTTSLFCEQGER